MENAFCLLKELKLILYGANAYSEKLFHSLSGSGHRIVAFFDKRYKELNGEYPVPVYGLSDHPFVDLAKDDFCVIIMLQNAMQHEPIAMELFRQGFRKVLFAPMKGGLEEKTALALRYYYNLLLEGQFHMLRGIPLLKEEVILPEISSSHAVIKEEGDVKIVWCPAELLYTTLPRLCREPEILRYANVPLYSFFPYMSLFEYLRGTGERNCQYLEEYGVNSCKYPNSLTNEEVVSQRKQLLEIYKDALNKGMDFFISSAPPAEWNARFRVFNLLDGQHRSLFLAMEEFRCIPVRISQKDFEKWNVFSQAERLQEHLVKGGARPHILHPEYNRVNEKSDRNDLLQLERIQEYLGGDRDAWRGMLEGKSVLDLSGSYGYYARNALRMRAEKAVLYAPEGKEAAGEIHMLEGFSDIPTVDDWSEVAGERYHVLFVLDSLMNLSLNEKKTWIGRCAGLCLEECFVTVRDSAELALWEKWFSESQELRTLFSHGQLVRLYVLRKEMRSGKS